MRTEDDVRAALVTLEQRAPSADAVLEAVHKAAGRRRPGLARALRSRHRMSPWLVPLTAAASVAAVIAASVGISSAIHPHRRTAQQAASPPLAGLPAFYVGLHADKPSDWPHQAIVRATRTGAVVATLIPPAPYRVWVQAAGSGNGHDFVLIAAIGRVFHQNGGTYLMPGRSKYFLLKVGHGGHPATLAPLPVAVPANTLEAMALSPDASKLALTWGGGDRGYRGAPPTIEVVDLATGTVRTWTWPGGPRITANSGGDGEVLSWTADGRTLAYQQWVGGGIDIRLLDTTTPGGSLPASSRMGLRWPDAGDPIHFAHGKITNDLFGFSAIITPDGSKIAAATFSETKRPLNSELQFTEFAVGSGTVERVLYPWRLPGLYPGQVQDVLWSNHSGSKLIVVAHPANTKPVKEPRSRNGAAYRIELGVVSGNHFTPLPGAPPLNTPASWPVW